MEYPFGINQYGYSNTDGYADQVSITEILKDIIGRATGMRSLMTSIWSGPQDG